MDRIAKLEQGHVEVHTRLLKSLDQLYLLRNNLSPKLSLEHEQQMEVRRQLQLSLEKSVAIIRTLQRVAEDQAKILISNDTQNDSEIPPTNATAIATATSTEHLLAIQLENLMEENYELDDRLSKVLKEESNVQDSFQQERQKYSILLTQFKDLADTINEQQDNSTEDIATCNDPELLKENITLEELIIALKVHGGYNY